MGATLKAAEDYDGIADAGDTDNAYNAFKPLGESLAAVSTTNEGDIRKFWNWATRLLAFAQKLESGHNENRQKVQKSIDDHQGILTRHDCMRPACVARPRARAGITTSAAFAGRGSTVIALSNTCDHRAGQNQHARRRSRSARDWTFCVFSGYPIELTP